MNTLAIGDHVNPVGIALIAPLAWEVVDFYEVNGFRQKTVLEHPVTKDRVAQVLASLVVANKHLPVTKIHKNLDI